MKKVSCRPSTFVPKVSNYSRGIFFSKKYEVFTLCCPYIVRRFSSVRKKFRVNHLLSCRKFPIIVEGYFFQKVRSFYSLLSIYSQEIFFCKKKVSRKPLSLVPKVSNISRRSFKIFSKTPHQKVW